MLTLLSSGLLHDNLCGLISLVFTARAHGLAFGSKVSTFQRGLASVADWLAPRLAVYISQLKLHHYSPLSDDLKLLLGPGARVVYPRTAYGDVAG